MHSIIRVLLGYCYLMDSNQVHSSHACDVGSYTRLGLPVDPSLGAAYATSPQLPLPLGTHPEIIGKTAAAPVDLISEGIPAISKKLIWN